MNATLSQLFADGTLAAAALLLGKVTLMLAAGGGLVALLRRRSAAVRHDLWRLGAGRRAGARRRRAAGAGDRARLAAGGTGGDCAAGGARGCRPPAADVPAPNVTRGEAPAVVPAAEPARPAPKLAPSPRLPAPRIATLFWMLGAAAVLLRCAVGHLGLRRLARSARPLANAEWQAQLAETAASLGLRRMPDLRASEAVGTPVTWGVRRPFVILPAEADSWPSERRRAALLHELAHLERGDYLAQLAGTVACAVYWFHPLAWMALRQLKRESERACDDRVLAAGAAPAEYAAQLLEVARGAHARRLTGLAPAIAMARPSTLEGRLLAVLDETTPRGAISLRSRLAGALAVATLLVPFASLTPVARAAAMAGVPAAMAGSPEIAIAAIAPRVLATVTVKPDGTSSIAGETATGEGEQTDMIDAAVTASPGEELELDLETGADVSIQGWDEPRVEVNGTLGGRDWRDSQITVSRESGGVRVHSFYDRRARSQSSHHELTIRVPRRFDVDLESAGGDLAIRDVEGSFHGSTGGGSMMLTNLRGEAKLSTGGGEVNVSDSNLSGTVSTGGGGVRLSRISGGLRGNSGSGPVVYRDPPPGSDTTGAVGDLVATTSIAASSTA